MIACDIAVIGGGPAGLAATEAGLAAGLKVMLFETKPSLARKFLMAGKSGLNLTKEEATERFLAAFPPQMHSYVGDVDLRQWAENLGEEMFTGSTGRVFPVAMKASPLLRKWLIRLDEAEARTGWHWRGWEGADLVFDTADGPQTVRAHAQVFALGGGSWPRLGSDGGWVNPFREAGIQVASLEPSNMGFNVGWSDVFRDRFAGQAVKTIAVTHGPRRLPGEFMITKSGIEGGVVYAHSAALRMAGSGAEVTLDLMPGRSTEALKTRLERPRGKLSRSNFLRKSIGLVGVKAGLLRELAPDLGDDPGPIAKTVKALELKLGAPRPLAEAISSAGGVSWDELDANLMLKAYPGRFVAGEMLDWEAPTGGYLLTGCFGTGFQAGKAAANWCGDASV